MTKHILVIKLDHPEYATYCFAIPDEDAERFIDVDVLNITADCLVITPLDNKAKAVFAPGFHPWSTN